MALDTGRQQVVVPSGALEGETESSANLTDENPAGAGSDPGLGVLLRHCVLEGLEWVSPESALHGH